MKMQKNLPQFAVSFYICAAVYSPAYYFMSNENEKDKSADKNTQAEAKIIIKEPPVVKPEPKPKAHLENSGDNDLKKA
jgi:hypothetical protein